MRNIHTEMATSDTHIHTTPKGHEIRAEVVYDIRGPQVTHAVVTHCYTGVIRKLGEQERASLREALYAGQLRERAQADVEHLKARFGQLENALGPKNPALRDYQRERMQMEQFAEVAQDRRDMLMKRIDKNADKIAESPIKRSPKH